MSSKILGTGTIVRNVKPGSGKTGEMKGGPMKIAGVVALHNSGQHKHTSSCAPQMFHFVHF